MVDAPMPVLRRHTGGVPGHGASGERRRRSAVIAMLVGVLGCLLADSTAAAADYVWSGAAPTTAWSSPGNWGDGAPSGAVGVLAFPRLTGACAAGSPAIACYHSSNDRDGLSADAIFVDDGAGYDIDGRPITLGAGGLTAASAVADPGNPPSVLSLPIVLGAAQTWTMTGATPDEQLLVTGFVSDDGSHPLAITLANGGGLTLQHVEVGPVTISGGDGFVKLGRLDDGSGSTLAGLLNVTDKHPTSVTGGAGLLGIKGAVGPLRTSDGLIQVGQVDRAGTLSVNGDVTLDAQSELRAYVNEPGTTPGTSYSRLTAEGDIDLAQASLLLTAGELPGGTACAQLGVGDELRIVSAAGRLTGRFANAADGATLTLPCGGSGGDRPTARIAYTASAVTATILTPGTPGAPTATALSLADAGAVTNQPLTLTATVTSVGAPSGTVTFRRIGVSSPPLPGCDRRPVTPSGAMFTATCQTAFRASGPAGVDAVFTPADGSPLEGSASPPRSVQVARAATTTSLTVSPGSVGVNQPAALTAHIAPAWTGAAQPSGTVTFLSNGNRIAGCTDVGVTGGQSTAGCGAVLGYGTAKATYAVTAVFSGDDDFTGSTAPATIVTFTGPAAAAAGSGGGSPRAGTGATPAAAAPGKAKVGRASASANTVNAVVTCKGAPGQRCAVTLTLTIARRISKTRVTTSVAGSKKITLRAGDGITAHVRLNALAARKLRSARKLSMTLAATEKTARGTRRLPAQKITIKAIARRGR